LKVTCFFKNYINVGFFWIFPFSLPHPVHLRLNQTLAWANKEKG
jgi:hypothetical protein